MDTIASPSAPVRTPAARASLALLLAALLPPAFAQSLPDPPPAPVEAGTVDSTRPPDTIDSVPSDWTTTDASPPDAAPLDAMPLASGDYLWEPERAATGPVVIVVSLPEQRMHVYRGGVRIGLASISTGREGMETPTGVFPILQKEVDHRSNLYNDAPMPYMQRLTWDGIALHEGRVPGYPASHGCIRVPDGFGEALFDITERGTLVVVADEASNDPSVVWPGPTAPVDAYTGLEPGRQPPLDPAPGEAPSDAPAIDPGAVATN